MEPASFSSFAATSAAASRTELVTESPQRIPGGRRHDFGLDLHRDGDLAVSQDLHGPVRVHVQGGQQRPARLAGAVDGDPADLRFADAAVEAAGEVARLDRRAAPGGENQAGLHPAGTGSVPVGVLLLPAELERGDAQVRKGKRGF